MALVNENYLNLSDNYLFSKIASEKKKYIEKNKDKKLIDLSIGDVTLPLCPASIEGIKKAANLLSKKDTFEGYPPSSGHNFLKEEILKYDYSPLNINLENNEIFIGDSSKSDIAHILDLFDTGITVAIQNPVYPVYLDSNVIRGNNIIFFNDASEILDISKHIDIIYLCSPNNPTGQIIPKDRLKEIINYAIKHKSLIFFDSAYEAFIQGIDTVHSIYEIADAKKVAIEFRSFSKTAGFTPIRLSYTIIPNDIYLFSKSSNKVSLNSLFKRLKDTKYNGPSFLSEYAMYNVYSTNSLYQLKENIDYYMKNVKLLINFFNSKNIIGTTKINSPYVWIKCKDNMSSWDFFYYMLDNFMILGTPGSGFGTEGEGYFRLTGFGTREDTLEAIERMKNIL
ncbi:MAG: LL-diaminopimelate aminotransferase [Clostridia bacterium]|nr:LL-diaminopimelate aminotransferase [Clostridia bacterium]